MLKEKREGTKLGFKVFEGADGNRYLVFRSLDGSFHVFAEVEAKAAAKQCGAGEMSDANTREMWESLWGSEAAS
jgi:hypothetical protein